MSDRYGEGRDEYEPQYVQPGEQGWYAPQPPLAPPSAPPAYGPADQPPTPPGAQPGAPRRRRVHPAVLIVAGVCVAAAVVGLLVAFLTQRETVDAPGTSGRRLAIPASIPGYRVVRGVPTDDLKAELGDEIAKKGDDPDDVVRHAAVGVWQTAGSRGDADRIVFIGLDLRDIPSFRAQVKEDGVEATLKFFLAGVGDSSTSGSSATTADYPPGPRGGFMRCTTTTISGSTAGVCGWGDESAFALTIAVGQPSTVATARIARDLRAAIERG